MLLNSTYLDNGQPANFRSPDGVKEFSLSDLCRILSIRRATIAWMTASAVVLALAISLCMTPKYAAESAIEINPENSEALDLQNSPSAVPQSDYAMTLATQANVLQSDTLALEVIQQLNLEQAGKKFPRFSFFRPDNDALPLEQSPARRTRLLKKFHRNLSVRVLGGTRILQVRYLDPDPAIAAAVTNTLINDYLEQYFQTRYNATRQASDWLSKQLADLKSEVEASQQRLADYQKQTGILGESETNNVVMAKLEEINRQLSAAEANRIVKQAVWQLAKTGDPELISSVAGSSFVQGVSTNPAQLGLLPTLRAQEAQLKADIAQSSARLGPAFPKILQMRSELAELQASIDLEVTKIAARAQNDYLAAKNAEDMERALFDKQKQEANKLNDSAIQYGILKREGDTSRDLYEGLLGKLKQASVLAGLRSSNIVVVDPARPAAKPASPNYLLNLLLGLGAGLVGGIGCALIQDSTDKAIHSPQDVKAVAGLRSLAVLPNMRNLRANSRKAIDSGEAAEPRLAGEDEIGERFRTLRTALLLSNIDRPPKVILVSSALPREGKTTVSVNLARVFAQQGGRVLLVDADLRRPSVHLELDNHASATGLSSWLTTPASGAANAPVQDLGSGLHVLMAGPRPPFPAEMLASRRMSLAVAAWRDQFDQIVLDTPPVLSVTDAVALSRCADAVLLVVRADSTSSDALLRAGEILEQAHAPVLGAVVNGMNFRSAQYSHYFGYSFQSKKLQERQQA